MTASTIASGTPRISRTVAAAWRASWSRLARRPAASRRSFHSWWSVFGFSGSPVGEVKT
jgi:hypothetical protein